MVNYSDFLDNTEYNYVAIRTWNWSFHTLDARWNYWGEIVESDISQTIYDNSDDSSLPVLQYTPYAYVSIGEILLKDDFEDGEATGWSEVSGNWNVVQGRYRQSSDIPDARSLHLDNDWENYSFQVDVSPNAGNEFGTIFRAQDDSHYYLFSWSSTGRSLKLVNEEVITLYEDSSGAYQAGEMYQFTITAFGDRLRGYIDNNIIFDVTDDTFTAGGIGLFASQENFVDFDNVLVIAPALRPPHITLLTPHNGDNLNEGEEVLISAEASDEYGIRHVSFLVDGDLVGNDVDEPYEYLYTVPSNAGGKELHFQAKATNIFGVTGYSQSVTASVINTINDPPVANAGTDQTVALGIEVILDGSGSYDPDNDSITYIWKPNPDNPAQVSLSDNNSETAVHPSFTPSITGTYRFELVVSDGTVESNPDEVLIVVEQDLSGPTLGSVFFNGNPVQDLELIDKPGNFSVSAIDTLSGVNRVEFLINDNLMCSDSNSYGTFSCYWNSTNVDDGDYTLKVRAYDNLGNVSDASYRLHVQLAPPPSPTIINPANGSNFTESNIMISGTAAPFSEVFVLLNNVVVAGPLPIDENGTFTTTVELVEGDNQLQVTAQNRSGSSAKSPVTLVSYDTGPPNPPLHLMTKMESDGLVSLSWQQPEGEIPSAYLVYRSDHPFTDTQEPTCITPEPTTALNFNDVPPSDGLYYYAVTAVDRAGNESKLSILVSAFSDKEGPALEQITYIPEGDYVPGTNRFGPGRVNVSLKFSENLSRPPSLSIRLSDGDIIPVHAVPSGSGKYNGYFEIHATNKSGQATWQYSGIDWAGNRSSLIEADPHIEVDTKGPSVTNINFTPSIPFRNDPSEPLNVTVLLTLDQDISEASSPDLAYYYRDGSGPYHVTLTQDNQNPLTWHGSFTLKDSAGQSEGDYIEFTFKAIDDVGNEGSLFLCPNRFEVYQGDLPPLPIPTGLIGTALPDGKIQLTWNPVVGAAGYQIYRQAPGEGNPVPYGNIISSSTFEETTEKDGIYLYAVASIRSAGEQEATSAPSSSVSIEADSKAPNPPVNLVLEMSGDGVIAKWQMPTGEVPSAYRMYRANTEIDSVVSLEALISNITSFTATDAYPSLEERYYAVTAVDEAGNESAPSPSVVLNTQLLPITDLVVQYDQSKVPHLSWGHPTNDIEGFNIYVVTQQGLQKINSDPLSQSFFDHVGYSRQRTEYRIVAVDGENHESLPKSAVLPDVSFEVVENKPFYRGLINRLKIKVTNLDTTRPLHADDLIVQIGNQVSHGGSLDTGAGGSVEVDFLFSGNVAWNDYEEFTVTLQDTPAPGTTTEVIYSGSVPVESRNLHVDILNDQLVRGTVAPCSFVLTNTGTEGIELVTATNTGANPSPDVHFYLLDSSGNILSSATFKQTTGADVTTKADGTTVARIAPGGSFTSGEIPLIIPLAAPDDVKIRIEIDRVKHYDYVATYAPKSKESAPAEAAPSEESHALEGPGTTAVESRILTDTAYVAEITNAEPESTINNGRNTITITGRALLPDSSQTVSLAPVRIAISNNGYLRTFETYTDDGGEFTFEYTPLPTEAGTCYACATHPMAEDRCNQTSFYLSNISIRPSRLIINVPRNYTRKVDLDFTYEGKQTLHNVSLEYDPAFQQDKKLLTGITVEPLNTLSTVEPGQSGKLSFNFSADASAPERGSIVLAVTSDETVSSSLKFFDLSYNLITGETQLSPFPKEVVTGVHPGENIVETILLKNIGTETADITTLQLIPIGEDAIPDWIVLNPSKNDTEIAPGEEESISITFQPGTDVAKGIYECRLQVKASESVLDIPVTVTVTAKETGDARIYVYDPYVWQNDGQGGRIEGLADARIVLQHATAYTIIYEGTTDDLGNCDFSDVPIGRYNYTITAPQHKESSGTVLIKPGVKVRKEVYLDIAGVIFEWSVVPVKMKDIYEIKLDATFKTNVPEPVVTITPFSLTLPDLLPGEVYYGEFEVENHGLITAENFSFWATTGNPEYVIEMMIEIPTELLAKEKIIIPYRITRLGKPQEGQFLQSNGTRETVENAPAGPSGGGGGSGSACEAHCFNPCPWDPSKRVCVTICSPVSKGYASRISAGGGSSDANTGQSPKSAKALALPAGRKICADDIRHPNGTDCAQTDLTHSEVDLVNRRYKMKQTDIELQVRGLPIQVFRQYAWDKWSFSYLDQRLTYTFDSDALKKGIQIIEKVTIDGFDFPLSGQLPPDDIFNEGPYAAIPCNETNNPCYQGKNFFFTGKEFTIRTLGGYFKVTDGTQFEYYWSGFRLESRHGYWKEFDRFGRLIAYGDLNSNHVTLKWENGENGKLTGIVDPTGRQVIWYEYNSQGKIAAVHDHTGRRVEYTYSGDNLIQVKDVLGGVWSFTYDSYGKLISKTDPLNRTFTIEYDANGYVTSVKGPDGKGNQYSYAFDETSQQRITTIKNPTGLIRELVYDSKGRLERKSFNDTNVQEYIQDDRHMRIRLGNGMEKQATFDEWGNMIRVVEPDGITVSAEYNPFSGKLSKKIDERGITTEYEFDDRGNITAKIEASGTPLERRTEYQYDQFGNCIKTVLPGGGQILSEYDNFGNIIKRTDPMGNSEEYTYNNRNNRISWKTKRGFVWHYFYDDADHLTSMTDPLGNTISFEYDAVGNLISYTDANNNLVQFEYDAYDRIKTITDPLGFTKTYEYDDDGRVTKITDQNGNSKTFSYDSEGNLKTIVDAKNNETSFAYKLSDAPYCPTCDPAENPKKPIEIHYPTYTERYEYDVRGHITKKTKVLDDTTQYEWQYTYDGAGNLTSIRLPDNSRVTYKYDALNRLVEIVDPFQNSSHFEYDSRDNLISVTEPAGYERILEYDLNGRIISEKVAGKGKISYEYDPAGNIIKVTQANGSAITLEYNQRDLLTKRIDPFGNQTEISYDPMGHVIKVTYPNGGEASFEYDAKGRVVKLITPLGETINFTRDGLGNIVSKTDYLENTWYYEYDELNRLTTITDPTNARQILEYTGPWLSKKIDFNGKVTLFERDSIGRVVSRIQKMNDTEPSTDEDDLVTTYHYDTYFPTWTRQIDPLNRTTTRILDAMGRVTRIVYPDARYSTFEYTPNGDLLSMRDLTGNIISYEYDEYGRLSRIKDTLSTIREINYDDSGNIETITGADGNTLHYVYDALYRIKEWSDASGNTGTYTYDAMGHTIKYKDREGNESEFSYDLMGNELVSRTPLGRETEFTYDLAGHLLSAKDALGNLTSFTYNALGQLKTVVYPDNTSEEFSYDSLGNILAKKNRDDSWIHYSYDDAYRVTAIDYPGTEDDVSFIYDKASRMLEATNSSATITFTYDPGNRVLSETINGRTVRYTYDDSTGRKTIQYPGTDTVVEVRDIRRRVTQIEQNGSVLLSQGYDSSNLLTSRTFSNGITANFSYDSAGNMVQAQYMDGETPLAGFEYGYDREGNLLWEKHVHDPHNSFSFVYDSDYRLLGWRKGTLSEDHEIITPTEVVSYNLDSAENWLSVTRNGITENRSLNSLNQYTEVGTQPYQYDANGNLTDDGVHRYTYTPFNMLRKITRKADSSIVAEYAYDPFHRRIEKKTNNVTYQYVYDNDHIIEEYANGALNFSNIFAGKLDDIVFRSGNGTGYFYMKDHIGSIRGLADSNGNIIEHYRYEPYGQPNILDPSWQSQSSSTVENPYMFTGKRWDPDTDIYYSRLREYSPVLGRFLQPDSLRYNESMNLYQYALNNPLKYIDPYGQESLGQRAIKAYHANPEAFTWQQTIIAFFLYANENLSSQVAQDWDSGLAKGGRSPNFTTDLGKGFIMGGADFYSSIAQGNITLPLMIYQGKYSELVSGMALGILMAPGQVVNCVGQGIYRLILGDVTGGMRSITHGTIEGLNFMAGLEGTSEMATGLAKAVERKLPVAYRSGLRLKDINNYRKYAEANGLIHMVQRGKPTAPIAQYLSQEIWNRIPFLPERFRIELKPTGVKNLKSNSLGFLLDPETWRVYVTDVDSFGMWEKATGRLLTNDEAFFHLKNTHELYGGSKPQHSTLLTVHEVLKPGEMPAFNTRGVVVFDGNEQYILPPEVAATLMKLNNIPVGKMIY